VTLSLKDLTNYSGVLSIGFFAIALLTQTPNVFPLRYVALMKEHGNAGAFGAFVLAVIFSFAAVGTASIWRQLDHSYLHDKLIPCMAALLITFGLTCLCKVGSDPFPSIQQFWRFGCLAYGIFLLDFSVPSDGTPSSKGE
jgi:hypothetical protein